MPDFVTPFDQPSQFDPKPRAIVAGGLRFPSFGALGPRREPPSIWHALWRGARGRCAACDDAWLFAKFLKPVDRCPSCGQEWSLHNADDFPPYIVILVVGHIVVTGMITVETGFHPPMWVHTAIWIPLIVVLSLVLLQPVKGAVIAYQWWYGMSGFGVRNGLEAVTSDASSGARSEQIRPQLAKASSASTIDRV